MARADAPATLPRSLTLTARLAGGGPIVTAAVEVFARLGFGATRVEDILASAGVARRTFYKYFSGKEDVLAAVYDLAATELLKTMREAAARVTPLETLHHGLDLYLDAHVENAPLLRVLLGEGMRPESPLAAGRRRMRGELIRVLQDAVEGSTGKTYDPLLYGALISALEGVSVELLESDVAERDVARAKQVMRLLLDRVFGFASV